MDTKGGKRWGASGGGGMNWEIGIDIYTLICIKWITNKNLLYKKINKIQKKRKKIGKLILKVIRKSKVNILAKTILKKKKKVGRLS